MGRVDGPCSQVACTGPALVRERSPEGRRQSVTKMYRVEVFRVTLASKYIVYSLATPLSGLKVRHLDLWLLAHYNKVNVTVTCMPGRVPLVSQTATWCQVAACAVETSVLVVIFVWVLRLDGELELKKVECWCCMNGVRRGRNWIKSIALTSATREHEKVLMCLHFMVLFVRCWLFLLCTHILEKKHCLQCFDTVGWALGRASGL